MDVWRFILCDFRAERWVLARRRIWSVWRDSHCALYGIYDGDFRKAFPNRINDNFLSTLGYVLLLLAIYEVWSLLLSALLFFFSRITVAVLAYILACLVYLAMHVLLLFAVSSIYLWLPCMQITGFAAFEALHYSYQLVTPVKWLMVCGQMLALLGVELLLAICAAFIPTSAAFLIWTTLVYTCMIMVFCVRMQIAYFDRDNMERADLIRYYQK